MTVVTLSGNPRPASRTARLARALGGTLAEALDLDVTHLDLAELPSPLGPDAADTLRPALDTLAGSTLAVVATPTYKGAYTGLLKAFLDLLAPGALAGVVAVPVHTLGSPAHTLAADLHLRPLLVELGASTPTRAVTVLDGELAAPPAAAAAWAPRLLPDLRVLTRERVAAP
jgi:FMN reductase